MISARKMVQEIANSLVQSGPHVSPWEVELIEPLEFGSFFLKVGKDFKRQSGLDPITFALNERKFKLLVGKLLEMYLKAKQCLALSTNFGKQKVC